MELIQITPENLATEHICCAISNEKDVQVASKKAWLKERLEEGLVFLKCDVRGKCFVEYLPAEYAWAPVEADGFMYINCLWVSGQFKGQGYSNLLLEACIRDSREKGKQGLVILSSEKKMGFLADPKYLKYKGFEAVDRVDPYFVLYYLPFTQDAPKPQFKAHLKEAEAGKSEPGFVLYYTHQCPFTAKYVPILVELAQSRQVAFQVQRIDSREQAQSAPSPFTSFALYYEGELVSHEILSEKKFAKLLESKGL